MPDTVLLTPHHRIRLDARLGALHLSVALELCAPWTILFGPSGSGKSTLLRALCGLPLADPNAVSHFERLNPDGSSRILDTVPSPRRNLAYAPQSPALLPHLTAARNVRFPSDARSKPAVSSNQPRHSALIHSTLVDSALVHSTLVDDALTLFHLHPLAHRRPSQLSGGEAQRVNLARAFATPGAKLLLLDEPFNGIDRALRDALLPELRRTAAERNLPVLSVTHDVEEALRLNAEVVRLEQGRITAQGPARQVLAEEAQRIAAVLA